MIRFTESEAFEHLCKMLHQDIGYFANTHEEMALYAIDCLTKEERPLAKAYIEKLLDGSHSKAEIRQIWQNAPRQLRIDDDNDLINFLHLLVKALG
jgi:hypothetical protein